MGLLNRNGIDRVKHRVSNHSKLNESPCNARDKVRSPVHRQVRGKAVRTIYEGAQLGEGNPFFQSALNLHQRLGTGLSSETLNELRKCVRLLCLPTFDTRASLESLDFFAAFQDSAKKAWERLVALMDRAEEGWPVPAYLGRNGESESVAQVVSRRQALLQRVFLSASPEMQTDLAIGTLNAWNFVAPRSSLYWHQGVVLAVGAGLHLQFFLAGLEA